VSPLKSLAAMGCGIDVKSLSPAAAIPRALQPRMTRFDAEGVALRNALNDF